MLDGILQISEYQTIYRVRSSLRNHFTGGMFQQRNILPKAKHIEIAQGAKGMSLTQISVLCILIIPGNAFTLIDKLIAAEDGCIIALPQGFVHIGIRWCLIHVETVENLGIACIGVSRTAKALVTHRLGQLIDGEQRAIRNGTLPTVVAAIERAKSILLTLIVIAGIRFCLGNHIQPTFAARCQTSHSQNTQSGYLYFICLHNDIFFKLELKIQTYHEGTWTWIVTQIYA